MYPHCQPRAKYGRRDPIVIPFPAVEHDGKLVSHEDLDNPKEIGTITVVRTTPDYDYLECAIDGRIVPAYRIASADKCYCVCQNLSYKVAQPTLASAYL